MEFFNLLFKYLCLISVDSILGFSLYLLWKYLDLKYFSKFEVTLLQNEIEFLKQENKKINGTSTDFWR